MATITQKITPFLWYDTQAEEAANYYVSVFKNSKITALTRYNEAASKASGQPEGTVMTVAFQLDGQNFTAINGGPHFTFSCAVSFVVNCASQEELDYYWEKLSAGGDERAQHCGWLADKFGLSWQIVPANLTELLAEAEQAQRVMSALMQMKKIDIATLEEAAKN